MRNKQPSNVRPFQRPARIPLDRKNINAMYAKAVRLGGDMLHVETDAHGGTIAFLERQAVPS